MACSSQFLCNWVYVAVEKGLKSEDLSNRSVMGCFLAFSETIQQALPPHAVTEQGYRSKRASGLISFISFHKPKPDIFLIHNIDFSNTEFLKRDWGKEMQSGGNVVQQQT